MVCLGCVFSWKYLFIFLVLCFDIGGVFSFVYLLLVLLVVYICGIVVDLGRLCFGFVC